MLHDKVIELRKRRLEKNGKAHSDELQGISKDRIRTVLTAMALGGNRDLLDCVFALLDDETPSWFPKAPKGATISSGASTAHLACHIGILQRGGGKLDREGRDYWIKPLRELGGFEAVTLTEQGYVAGHVRAKSPNSAYRLQSGLKQVLQAPDDQLDAEISAWVAEDAARERRRLQAEMEEASLKAFDTGHAKLIRSCVAYYVPRFLPGFEIIYVDDADGDRISEKERAKMARAGVELTLDDAMPDVLLWNPQSDQLWVIEAVTSDGEVDFHKVEALQRLCTRSKKSGVGFTTVYETWKRTAARQAAHKNLAINSFLWILEDPAKHFRVESYS